MKCILGKKLGMVQLFDTTGKVWPATVVYCEPNRVIEVKEKAVKVGFDSVEAKKLNKAQVGTFKKAGSNKCYRNIAEFADITGYKVGDEMKVGQFKAGEYVDVQGTTKGRGFTGAIKRWNFKIGPLSHGAGYPHRYQGSIAMGRGGSQAQRVRKGQRMSGHYGNELVTIENLQILYVNERDNTITILGAIPGHVDGTVFIKGSVKKANKLAAPIEIVTKANMEEIQEQNEVLQDKEAVKEQNAAIDKQEAAAAEAEKKAKEAAAVAKAEEEKAAAKAAKEGK